MTVGVSTVDEKRKRKSDEGHCEAASGPIVAEQAWDWPLTQRVIKTYLIETQARPRLI